MSEMRKLMEAVKQLNEEYVEYRDPDGEFQIIYDFPRGYFAVGKNDAKQDISGESFDNVDDAIEHAEICLSIGHDDFEDQFVDEAKWDYPKGMKGKGAAYKEPHGGKDKGAANRKSRKAFRKAQKAEAHAAHMSGNINETF